MADTFKRTFTARVAAFVAIAGSSVLLIRGVKLPKAADDAAASFAPQPAHPRRDTFVDRLNAMLDFTRVCMWSWLGVVFWFAVAVVQAAQPTVQPILRGKWPVESPGCASDVDVAGNYAYIVSPGLGLVVIEVSDPANYVQIGNWDAVRDTRGVSVSGNYAYVASGSSGLVVIDVSNPTNCFRVGSCDGIGYAMGVTSGTFRFGLADP